MSHINYNEIETISNELKQIANNLQSKYDSIIENFEKVENIINQLESYNGKDASSEWDEQIQTPYPALLTKKKIWNVEVSNKELVNAYKNISCLEETKENVELLNLQGNDLYEISAILRGLVQATENELSIPYKNDILSFCHSLNQNQIWKQIVEEQKLNETLSNNFMKLAHLDIYNQTGTYAKWRDNSITDPNKTIEDVACGLSIYMAITYLLTGNDTDYLDFFKEAGGGSEDIHHGPNASDKLFNGIGSNIYRVNQEDYEQKYGITIEEIKSKDKQTESFIKELKKGNPVITLVQYGERNVEEGGFNPSSGQHFIVLADYNPTTNQIYVYNPHGENTGWQDVSTVEKYITNCNVLSLRAKKNE